MGWTPRVDSRVRVGRPRPALRSKTSRPGGSSGPGSGFTPPPMARTPFTKKRNQNSECSQSFSRHGPRVNRNPRGGLQPKREPLVRRDCGPRGDVCRSPPWGPQIRSTDIATLPKPRPQGRESWPDGTLPSGGALLARGVRNRFQMSGRLERPKTKS